MADEKQRKRLQTLRDTGLASAAELAELAVLESGSIAPASAQTATEAAGLDEVELNTESFARGGQNAIPPSKEGIYPAVCTGWMRPDRGDDQIWFLFENKEIPFRGALVTAALNALTPKSGAWKFKQVLDALGVKYITDDKSVRFQSIVGRKCQVDWQSVNLKGKLGAELRIQDVYPAAQKIEQAV